MSAIGGIFNKRDEPVDLAVLERSSERLAHRGADAGTWHDRHTGLLQRERGASERARLERQPLVDVTGRFVLVSDARLDEREELCRSIGREDVQAESGDGALILAAFERWGSDCLDHLYGDFAFAIWDARDRELFCARDPVGVRPFYYVDTPQCFAFASEVQALLRLPCTRVDVDELRIGFFLQRFDLDEERSFYADVRRLPPGHWLRVTTEGARIGKYFDPGSIRPLAPASDEEYIEEYRRLFLRAVRSRVEDAGAVGSMLSGGLDSSSIVRAARSMGHRPHTFSCFFDAVPESDEREFVDAVLAGDRERAHILPGDQFAPFDEWRDPAAVLDGASYGANTFLNRAIYQATREEGLTVLLDGTDGDSVVGYGFQRLLELALRGRWIRLHQELGAVGRALQLSPSTVFQAHIAYPLRMGLRRNAPTWSKELWSALRGRPRGRTPIAPIIRADFAERVGLREQMDLRMGSRNRAAGGEPEHALTCGVLTFALETLDRISARRGLECRYPYFDRSFLQFCLGLPHRVRLQRGYTRYVQRCAGDFLPDRVRWRGWKADLSHNFSRAVREYEGPMLAKLVQDPALVEPYVDLDVLRSTHGRLEAGGMPDDAFQMSIVAGLATWLGQRETL